MAPKPLRAIALLCSSLLFAPWIAYAEEHRDTTSRDSLVSPSATLDPMNPTNWEIGPLIRGRLRSINMPRTQRRTPTVGPSISPTLTRALARCTT